MDLYCYNVFDREGIRRRVGDSDMTINRLALIFKVKPNSIFLLDDQNKTIFCNSSGEFPTEKLTDMQHYEVVGEKSSDAPDAQPMTPSTSTSNFTFRRGCQAQRSSKKITPKMIKKCIEVVEPRSTGTGFLHKENVYVSFAEDVSTQIVKEKVQEALHTFDEICILDNKGFKVQDSEATRDPDWWKSANRRILAMTEANYEETQAERGCHGKRLRKRDNADNIDEVTSKVQKLVDVSGPVESLASTLDFATDRKVLIPLSASNLRNIRQMFSCLICKGILTNPIYAGCCNRVLACKQCADRWYGESEMCIQCRDPDAKQKTQEVKGINFDCMRSLLD